MKNTYNCNLLLLSCAQLQKGVGWRIKFRFLDKYLYIQPYFGSYFSSGCISSPYSCAVSDDWKTIIWKLLQLIMQLFKLEEYKSFVCLSMVILQTQVLLNFFQFSPENTCVGVFLKNILQVGQPATSLRENLTQMFSCEYCETFKNSFFYKTPLVAAFESQRILLNTWKLK